MMKNTRKVKVEIILRTAKSSSLTPQVKGNIYVDLQSCANVKIINQCKYTNRTVLMALRYKVYLSMLNSVEDAPVTSSIKVEKSKAKPSPRDERAKEKRPVPTQQQQEESEEESGEEDEEEYEDEEDVEEEEEVDEEEVEEEEAEDEEESLEEDEQ